MMPPEKEKPQGAPTTPLALGIVTVVAGLIGAGVGAAVQGYANLKLERQKFESSLIQEALKVTDTNEAAKRLLFLVDTGVIQSLDEKKIRAIAEKEPGQLPVLDKRVSNARIYLLAGTPQKTQLFQQLKLELSKAGFNVLGEKLLNDPGRPAEPEIRYFHQADREQAEIIARFVRHLLADPAIKVNVFDDPSARPGYFEIWLGTRPAP